MKKVIYSIAIAAIMISGCKKEDPKGDGTPTPDPTPQVAVEKKNTSLLQKFTGTKCPPCGSWGWTMAEELITYGDAKALYLGTFSDNFVAQGFITNEATTMDKKWGVTGYPTFAVNGSLKLSRPNGGVNTTEEKRLCKESIDNFSTAEVVANSGVTYTIADGKIKIKSSVKFFKEVTGDYNVAFYIVENNAMWAQSGNAASNGTTPIAHHYVLRASANGAWGESVSTGTIGANQFKDVNAEIAMNSAWKAENLDVYAVIWQNTGSDYVFINASNTK